MKTRGTIGRREFIRGTSLAGLGVVTVNRFPAPALALGGWPSEKVVVAVMGLNGRGMVLARNFMRSKNTEVAYLCDVDASVLAKARGELRQDQTRSPGAIGDFRRALDDKDVDAIVIAAPDHWHAPAAILALEAGKHVYVEKPASHNARELELLVGAQQKYARVVQIGNQQRSGVRSIEAIQAIREGLIGRPYLARAWYANTRGSIGRGKAAPVPSNLDYEMWQGPAPRTPFRDNVVHYNWHWFRRWGTGEICNNGTHEIDVARWALGVDYPASVSSAGGRYHFDDDWEFTDTQEAVFEFEGGKTLIWQGQSCNGTRILDRGRGAQILGTAGSVVLDRDGYVQYDLKGAVVKEGREAAVADGLDFAGNDAHTSAHIENFANGVRTGEALRSPVSEIAKSVLLCHLGNIAQYTGRKLRIERNTGRIVGDQDAMTYWQRDYAPGWAPTM
ncbi:MAG TPA: Gfo/Idh/MocA family oxidoreductase [Gemmatimonadaceae bacterium]|nr:Gfo/Idh/MocA family oxidoreductase [Gemmatimonadaceae bacterium]